MGIQSTTNPISHIGGLLAGAVLLVLLLCSPASGQSSTPLLLPGGLAYDQQGNLYFSEAGKHLVRRLTPAGSLSIVAGTGTQGYGGDGGPAGAALLDSPGAVAIDAAGDLYFADTHNHRIRRVDSTTGVITTAVGTGISGISPDGLAAKATAIDLPSALALNTAGDLYFADARAGVVRRVDHTTGLVMTVAGNGTQGAQGDGGPARSASLDTPAGLALDAAGNLFISDSHNQRVRRIDAATGIITTVLGSGIASPATLRLPRGLAADSAGNLYIVDSGNHRLRRIDTATGQVVTIAGGSAEGFAGDEAAATQAQLDGPRELALSPTGLPTLADTANGRVRQVDANGVIHTLAGVGAIAPAGLALSGPASTTYGTGAVSVSLGGSAGSGTVLLLEGSTTVGSVALASNSVSIGTGTLNAGTHALVASYAGDSTHGPLLSNPLTLRVIPAPALATPAPATQVYGLDLPVLTGALSGVLARDATAVQVSFTSLAGPLSGAGSYPISALLSGTAAGNYVLTTAPAFVTISKAPSTLALTTALLAHVATTTVGQPGGAVTLLDGTTPFATQSTNGVGDAQFSQAGLSNGSHTLSAGYGGDVNFLPSAAVPIVVTIGPVPGADFSLASTGPSAVTVSAGSSALFTFTETPSNGGLSSPVVLSASGLPSGATATFTPAYLPPGSSPANFTLTVQTLKTAGLALPQTLVLAGLIGLVLLPRRRRAVLIVVVLCGLAGCGDRVNNFGQGSGQSRVYNITVNGTATSNTGTTLLHSVTVTLTVQ